MIYFDNSATTKVDSGVLDTYDKVSENIWGNPSSLHAWGEKAFNLLEQSRKQIADLMRCYPDEIYFTSGGSESDNWAIKGTAMEKRPYGRHLITSSVEHPAVMNTMRHLEHMGYDVTYLPVDKEGRVSVSDFKKAIRKDTILVSIMAVNNEIGTIEPIDEIAEVLKQYPKIHFHVDAVQAVGKGLDKMLCNPRIDLVAFSGHKFHAPRGIGIMYKRRGRKIQPLIDGGGQEKDLRGGTENLPAIAGMAKALRLVMEDEDEKVARQRAIKDRIYNHIKQFDKTHIFSQPTAQFAPHILCFTIDGVRGETIVHGFEKYGIYISTSSACSSKDGDVAGTLKAMKIPVEIASCAVRVSLDEHNTMEEADEFIKVFDDLYEKFKMINS